MSADDYYCGGCGDQSTACGCPFDLHTQSKMSCRDCGAQWWVAWGRPDRPCHGCHGTNWVTLQQAEYPPYVDPKTGVETTCTACRCFRSDVDLAEDEPTRALYLKFWGLHLKDDHDPAHPFTEPELRRSA